MTAGRVLGGRLGGSPWSRDPNHRWILGLVLAAAGVALALVIFYFEPTMHAVCKLVGIHVSRDFTESEEGFARRPETKLWIVSICAQAGLWAGLLVPLTAMLRSLRAWRSRATEVWGAFIFLGIFALLAAAGRAQHLSYQLAGHSVKTGIFTVLGFALAYVGAVGIWRVQRAADGGLANADCDDQAFERYLDLRATLGRLLAYLGATVSAAVLATSGLRHAVLTQPDARPGSFPQEALLLYGLVLSGLLALVYVPAYQRVQALGAELRDRACPMIWPPRSNWRACSEDRAALEKSLKLDASPASTLRPVLVILAPLATSGLSHVLGVK